MADEDDPREYADPRNAARAALNDALREYAAALNWEGWEGHVITGYVVVAEISVPGGQLGCFWVTGNGAPPSDGEWEGLQVSRVEGLMHWGLRKIIDHSEQDLG